MAFAIDDALLPATLTAAPMTDEEFASFCANHPDLRFETTGEGEIIVFPPTYSLRRNKTASASQPIPPPASPSPTEPAAHQTPPGP